MTRATPELPPDHDERDDDPDDERAELGALAAAARDGDRDAFEEPYPARTTVQAGLAGSFRVEIEAVARLPHPGA